MAKGFLSNVTVDGDLTIGQLVLDGNQSVGAGQDNYVLTYDNSTGKISLEAATGGGSAPTLSKSISIPDPTADDDATIFFTPVAITITAVHSHIVGATNVVFNINHASTRTGTGLDVFTSNITLTSTAGQTNNSGFNDATIPANSWVWLDVVSVLGTPTLFHTTIIYTED